MTTKDLVQRLELEGYSVSSSAIRYAVRCRYVSQPTRLHARMYLFSETHLDEFREYFGGVKRCY